MTALRAYAHARLLHGVVQRGSAAGIGKLCKLERRGHNDRLSHSLTLLQTDSIHLDSTAIYIIKSGRK